jgi:hypothetical protein
MITPRGWTRLTLGTFSIPLTRKDKAPAATEAPATTKSTPRKKSESKPQVTSR